MGRVDQEFRRRYPNISRELDEENPVTIQSVRTDMAEGEKAAARGEYPTAVDFIRLCETKEQAAEIIDYLEKRKEITGEYAARLREQLNRYGLRSFGKRRKPGVQPASP